MKYENESVNALADVFGTIEDFRDTRGKLHRLLDIFILTIYGSLLGHKDFTNMAAELKYHTEYFTELLGLLNGVPSHDTFSAVFGLINPEEFLECFISWISGIINARGHHVAIDGKAIRAACDKVHNGKVPYLVNAYVVGAGLCIGQIRIDEKTNEIKGIPEMLEWLDIDGAVITIDAIGCQKEIAKILIEKGADYVLPVKENQPAMHADIELEMTAIKEEWTAERKRAEKYKEKGVTHATPISDKLSVYEEHGNDHGRLEHRVYYVYNDNSCIDNDGWPSVKSIGMTERTRLVIRRDDNEAIIEGEPTVEIGTYIMSKEMDAKEFACYARGHWGVETSLHWVLDDYFREDRCTARIGAATENLGLMRKVVYNLMKLDPNVQGKSMKWKEVYYRNNFEKIEGLLFKEIPSKY